MKNKIVMPEGHSRPKTRRDFLAHGFIGFGASAALPSLLGLSAKAALAAECPGGDSNSEYVPFMAFDMAGGAALPGNFLAGGQGGPMDLLPSYNRLGWDPRANGALDSRFGLPMSATYSGMLSGMLSTMSAEAQANLRMGSICHFAQDDTSSNKLNASLLVLKAGNSGTFISNGTGSNNTISGGRSDNAYFENALKPIYASSFNDIEGAAKFGGEYYAQLNEEQLRALASQSLWLSNAQAEALVDMPKGELLKELTQCAYEKNMTFVSGITGLDPRQDANARTVWGINQNTNASDPEVVAASIIANAVKQNAGPSTWALGGCDYHNGTQETGDERDTEMGVQIGRAVEFAHLSGRPLFFQLLTDGGCGAATDERRWTTESGDKGMTVMGYYHPDGPPAMRDSIQIGHYTNGQSAARSTEVGAQPLKVAYAVFANYLHVIGKLDMFTSIVGDVFDDVDSLIVFE